MSVFNSATEFGIGTGKEPGHVLSFADTIGERIMKGHEAIRGISAIAITSRPRDRATTPLPYRPAQKSGAALDATPGSASLVPFRQADG